MLSVNLTAQSKAPVCIFFFIESSNQKTNKTPPSHIQLDLATMT